MMVKQECDKKLFDKEIDSLRVCANELDGMHNYNLSSLVWIAIAIATGKVEDAISACKSAKRASQRSQKADILVAAVKIFAEKGETKEAFATALDLLAISSSRHLYARIWLAAISCNELDREDAEAALNDGVPPFIRSEAEKDFKLLARKKHRHTGHSVVSLGQLKSLSSHLAEIINLHRPNAISRHTSLSLYLGAKAICVQIMSEALSK